MNILTFIFVLLLITVVLAVFYLKYRFNNSVDKCNLEADLDSEIKKISKKKPAYGLVLGVYKDGQSFIKGYGHIDNDSISVPNKSTVFQLGSVSKLFTSALLQILVDEGVVEMDATLGKLIGKYVELSSDAKQVTLRQLVTHTSGFPRVPKELIKKIIHRVGKKNVLVNPYSHIDLKDVFEYLKESKGKRKPGKFQYSNFGMGLLGHVLEKITDTDLETLASEKIFTPLGMKSTSIRLTPEMQKNLAQGFNAKGKSASLWTFSALDGAGCFNSNTVDMLKFVQANISSEAPLSQTFIKMHKPQANYNTVTGLGWMLPGFIDKFIGNKSIVWHNGMVGGYGSYISIDNEAKTGVMILSNKAIDPSLVGMMITRLVRTQSWSNKFGN